MSQVESIAQGALSMSAAALDADVHVVFALSRELTLVYFNTAYRRFAAVNGGSPGATRIGMSLPSAITPDVRAHFEGKLLGALRTGKPAEHDYVCAGGGRYREYHQIAFPSRRGDGLIVVNSLRVDAPMSSREKDARAPLDHLYRQQNGFITQCCNCRRTLRAAGGTWDWVPDWIDTTPPDTSHSICEVCYGHHWKTAGS